MNDAAWAFALGDPAEGIDPGLAALPEALAPVDLPHRTLDPETPYWYVADVDLPGVWTLRVRADDGAQLWADGERVRAVDGDAFIVRDARRLVVRVLNKAMYGGLMAVYATQGHPEGCADDDWPSPPWEPARPLPPPGAAVTFAAWADVQNGWKVFARHVETMHRRRPDFTVGVGDVVSDAHRPAPWRGLFDTLAPLGDTPTFLIPGNHDYDGCFDDFISPLVARYGGGYRAWSAGCVRCVALDPGLTYPTGIPEGSAQRRWFLDELESDAWKSAAWRIVFVHQPPFSQGWPEYHGELSIRELLEPQIERARIDVVVSGHTHDYERLTRVYGAQTTTFLILGGGGSGLESGPPSEEPVMDSLERRHHIGWFDATPERLVFEALDVDGRPFDTFTAR